MTDSFLDWAGTEKALRFNDALADASYAWNLHVEIDEGYVNAVMDAQGDEQCFRLCIPIDAALVLTAGLEAALRAHYANERTDSDA